MDVLAYTYFLNGFLMIALPLGLAIYLTRRWKTGARIWWIGAVTFLLSQTFHIPFNWGISKLLNQTGMVAWDPTAQLIFNAFFLGLSAGIFEETARYLILRWWAKDARSWKSGVMFGAGHGGVEAIIFGLLVIYTHFQMFALRNADLSKLVPANQLALAREQVTAYWSLPWYTSLLGALERFLTIPCQIAFAVLVMQVFARKQFYWLFLAIGYHTVLDGVTVFGQRYLGAFEMEGIIGLFAILSIAIIFFLRQPEPVEIIQQVIPEPIVPAFFQVQETLENLEKTRYQSQ
jgi:uncharacterized membrane protein YhfC